jgi:hypothetical protein
MKAGAVPAVRTQGTETEGVDPVTNDERHEEALDIIEEDGAEIRKLKAEVKRLQAIVNRLPTDASGRHVIAHEDELYHPEHDGGCGYYDGEQVGFYCGCGDYEYYPLSECWPTREAADTARAPRQRELTI